MNLVAYSTTLKVAHHPYTKGMFGLHPHHLLPALELCLGLKYGCLVDALCKSELVWPGTPCVVISLGWSL